MRPKERPRRNHQGGFSLTSVLLAVGLSAMVALGIASTLKNASDAQAALKARDDAENAKTLATLFLRDPESCRRSVLGGGTVALSAIESNDGRSVPGIFSKTGEPVLRAGQGVVARMTLEPIQKNRQIAAVSPTRYYGQLRLSFGNTQGFGGGAGDRVIPLVLQRSGARVDGCRTADSSGDGDEDNPHLNPRNCGGQYYRARPGSNGFSQLEEPVPEEMRRTLLEQSPPTVCDGGIYQSTSGFISGILAPRGPCAHVQREVDGQKYWVTPTLTEGTRSMAFLGERTPGTCQEETLYSVCINGRMVPTSSEFSSSSRGDCR